jgi:hypothetical protein
LSLKQDIRGHISGSIAWLSNPPLQASRLAVNLKSDTDKAILSNSFVNSTFELSFDNLSYKIFIELFKFNIL